MNNPFPRFFVAACMLLAFLSPLHAGEKAVKRPITLEDLWKVKRLGKPAISPDGAWVAVEVTAFDMDDNSSTTHLWLCSTDGKTQKQLTTGKGGASSPIWAPDGKSIAFVSKRDLPSPPGRGAGSDLPSPPGRGAGGEGVPQIYTIPLNGGEATQLSKLPMTPSGLKWSGDGKTIYCVVWTWPDTPDDASYLKKEKAKKDDKVQAYVIDDALYRYWDHWIADGKRPVVFAVDTASGKHTNLFAHTKRTLPASGGSAADYDVSPDGKEICFTSESAKELGMDYNLDLYTMSLEKRVHQVLKEIREKHTRKIGKEDVPYEVTRKARGAYVDDMGNGHVEPGPGRTFAEGAIAVVLANGEPKNITADNPADDFAPVYSPDGTRIAFSRRTTKFFYADRARVMVHIRRSGTNLEVTANLDRSCSSISWPSDTWLYFEAEDKGYHRFHRHNLRGHLGGSFEFSRGHTDVSLTFGKTGMTKAFLRSHFGMPASLFAVDEDNRPNPIEHFNDDLRAQWDLGEVKNITYKGADDDDVQMWVVYPPNFDKTKKWPLLMMIHGGPHNAITTDFHYRWNAHLFASKGYVVAIPNFHGSSGFGQKFTDSITGDMATKPMIDIMKATDLLEKEPYIDKSRTTAAGASYGGYMMAWLNGHTDRYKAFVCHAGVYNWHSMMASDIVRGRERSLGAFPWGERAQIDKQNPQNFAANFKTPTLVMHGEKDFRVPVTQGMEYFNTLKIKGVPTRFVYFPDENHWVLKPQNSRLWHREFFAWLDKYVGGGADEVAARLDGILLLTGRHGSVQRQTSSSAPSPNRQRPLSGYAANGETRSSRHHDPGRSNGAKPPSEP